MSACECPNGTLIVKRPEWNRAYSFEFATFEEIQGGENITSPVVTVTPVGLTVGATTIDGTTVEVFLSGGTNDVVYEVKVEITTDVSASTLSTVNHFLVSSPVTYTGSGQTKAAKITELFETKVRGKRRSITIPQATCLSAQVCIVDDAGDPFDLVVYPASRYTVAGATRETLGRGGENALFSVGTLVDPSVGFVEVPLAKEVCNNPGIYLLEVVLTDDDPYPRCSSEGEVVTALGKLDEFTYRITTLTTGSVVVNYDYALGVTPCVGVGQTLILKQQLVKDVCLVVSNTLYLTVERGIHGVPNQGCGDGPPTLAEVRLHLRDFPETNLLLDDYEFDGSEVAMAAERAVMYFNESPPPIITRYNTQTFPHRYHWLEAISYMLYLTAAAFHRRNKLPYSAGGVTIDDLGKDREYLEAAKMHETNWKEWVKMRKVSLNMSEGFDSIGSDYGCQW